MTTNQPDRIEQIQALIADFIAASVAESQATNERMERERQATDERIERERIERNERFRQLEEARERDRIESNVRLKELEQLTSSNAIAIQALTDDLVTFKLTTEQSFEQARQERQELRDAMLRLDGVAEGIANLLSSLDSDRPTILRKLNSIENKIDRVLERSHSNDEELQ